MFHESRDVVLTELGTLVTEYDAVPKSDSAWCVDDALGQLLIRLNAEIRRSRKTASVHGSTHHHEPCCG